MIRPRAEEIRPRLIQPRALGAVDEVPGEEGVVALVFHLEHERVVLGAVVGVVERRRNRILVGGIRFAVRVGRQRRHVLRDAGAERAIPGARRVADESPLIRVARSTLRRDPTASGARRRFDPCRARHRPAARRRSRRAGGSIANDTVSVVAKSSGPIDVPSGLVPNFSEAATSGGSTLAQRLRGQRSARPRRVRVRLRAALAAPPRAPRTTTRGLRQMTTGVMPGEGFTLAKVRYTFEGPLAAGAGAPRPRPARGPSG